MASTVPGLKTIDVIATKELSIPRASTTVPHWGTGRRVEPQHGRFYSYIQKSWTKGATIWRTPSPTAPIGQTKKINLDNYPPTAMGFLGEPSLAGGSTPDIAKVIDLLYNKNAFHESFRDLFCSFTSQISESPYMNFLPDDKGQGMSTIQFHPKQYAGQDPRCGESLMDFGFVKDRVIEEYNVLKCLRDSFPDVEGLGNNKNVPFEVAQRSGLVLLTVRIHVLEFLLKSVFAFHYFAPGAVEDVDQLAVYHIFNQMKKI